MNPLDAVVVAMPGLGGGEDKEGHRVWRTPDGDGVGLFYFAGRPGLPGDVDSLPDLRLALSRNASASGAALIEANVATVDGVKAVRQCVKVPQRPFGMTYLGSLIFQFRDFSFVLKIQCEERGMTGAREAVVLDEKLASGQVSLDDSGTVGWMKDPYDVARCAGLARSLADDEEHDQRFPHHPLSRARRFLVAAESGVRVAEVIKTAPRYRWGGQASKSKPWWRPW